MKRFVKRAILMFGLAVLITAFAVPAEAGRRHHYRVHHIGPRYHAVSRIHHSPLHHRRVHRVYVHRPVIVRPVPHCSYYGGPSGYYYGW